MERDALFLDEEGDEEVRGWSTCRDRTWRGLGGGRQRHGYYGGRGIG